MTFTAVVSESPSVIATAAEGLDALYGNQEMLVTLSARIADCEALTNRLTPVNSQASRLLSGRLVCTPDRDGVILKADVSSPALRFSEPVRIKATVEGSMDVFIAEADRQGDFPFSREVLIRSIKERLPIALDSAPWR